MKRFGTLIATLLVLLAADAAAEAKAKSKKASKAKAQHLSGMSIVGNDEAPKSLAIVPWKGSQLGDTLNAIKALGGGREPVDKDVFLRALTYYELRAGVATADASTRSPSQN